VKKRGGEKGSKQPRRHRVGLESQTSPRLEGELVVVQRFGLATHGTIIGYSKNRGAAADAPYVSGLRLESPGNRGCGWQRRAAFYPTAKSQKNNKQRVGEEEGRGIKRHFYYRRNTSTREEENVRRKRLNRAAERSMTIARWEQ